MWGKESVHRPTFKVSAQVQGAEAEGSGRTGSIHARGATCWLLAVTRPTPRAGIDPKRKARVPGHQKRDKGGSAECAGKRSASEGRGGRGAFPWLLGGGVPRPHGHSIHQPHATAPRSRFCPAVHDMDTDFSVFLEIPNSKGGCFAATLETSLVGTSWWGRQPALLPGRTWGTLSASQGSHAQTAHCRCSDTATSGLV